MNLIRRILVSAAVAWMAMTPAAWAQLQLQDQSVGGARQAYKARSYYRPFFYRRRHGDAVTPRQTPTSGTRKPLRPKRSPPPRTRLR